MQWYTIDNGTLCLGTDKQSYANFHVATDLKIDNEVTLPLSEKHIELIGSYPEDWYADDNIDMKINNAAKSLIQTNEFEKLELSEESLNNILELLKRQRQEYESAGHTQVTGWLTP